MSEKLYFTCGLTHLFTAVYLSLLWKANLTSIVWA